MSQSGANVSRYVIESGSQVSGGVYHPNKNLLLLLVELLVIDDGNST
jgi:hypothetical protein